jgi:hypothetical protein
MILISGPAKIIFKHPRKNSDGKVALEIRLAPVLKSSVRAEELLEQR